MDPAQPQSATPIAEDPARQVTGTLPPGIPDATASAQAAAPSGRRSKFSSVPPPGAIPAVQQASPTAPAQPMQASAPAQLPGVTSPQQHLAAPAHAHVAQPGQVPMASGAVAAAPQVATQPIGAGIPVANTPPPFQPAPADAALAQRILKLAEFVHRNGPAFEVQVRNKQGSSPDYAFLNNGLGSGYYRWALFCTRHQLPLDQPLPENWQPPQQAAAAATVAIGGIVVPPMPTEVSSGFAHVLQLLQGTQESIKASSAWFHACALHAAGMAAMILQRAHQLPAFEPQLHLLFLVNDIFFTGATEGQPISTNMAPVFQNLLEPLFTLAYRTSGCMLDAFTQLCGLLDLWVSRGIYPAPVVEAIKAAMFAVGAPIAPVVPMDAQPLAHSPPPGMAPHAGGPMGHPGGMPPGAWGPGPHHGPPPGGPGWGPPPGQGVQLRGLHHPPPDMQEEKEPYDMLSFPAGLLPKLVKRALKYEKEYTPLIPEDVENEPPIERPVKDAYLESRLARFYAEIAQYQPGQDRAAYELKLLQLGDGLLPAPMEKPVVDHAAHVSAQTNMRNDGSYAGPELGRGGVGAHAAATGGSDLYSQYRRQRSGRYHEMMASKSTNPNRPPAGH